MKKSAFFTPYNN